ncbi:hydroxysteroid dehydrogenase-like protein 2 [Paramacrobiotus metropolitanus]|uniref:hydroxysteroid dehydrogenase-like protein 2 n=1 Tax=Paramacrobiotus metropolitanus TaxID=2943436 RepID=UPI00244657E5|nr:hydroxysteroid dehydrogenase-like protein 2 [Paramacrobiotus metropolitanus]
MQNTGKLAGRTIFVTGGSRGIGKAIALKAAQDKANVVIAAKTVDPHPKLEGTIFSAAEEIEAAGGKCLPVQVDVRDEANVQEAVDKAVKKFGGIDILVNNASAIFLAGTLNTPMKRYDLMNQVNARGTFLTSKICLPHLKKSKNPHIINLSPPLNLNPLWFKNNLAYTMAKYGMSMCVLGMAEEFKDDGIAVNALWPRTAIWTAAMEMMTGDDKRCRKPEIVADAFYAIVTKNSREFTGNFCIDEKVLAGVGVTDLDQYAVDKSQKDLMPDFFLDEASEDYSEKTLQGIRDKAFGGDKSKGSSAGAKNSGSLQKPGEIFSAIGEHLKSSNDGKLKGVYAFDVEGAKWFIDMDKGEAGEGEGPGGKPVCTMTMKEKDFIELFTGKTQSAQAFMSGKLKIKGDMGAAIKLDRLLQQYNKNKA